MRLDLKVAIVKRGQAQWVIAKEIGVSENVLSRYIRGHGRLRPEQERKLIALLGLTEEELHEARATR